MKFSAVFLFAAIVVEGPGVRGEAEEGLKIVVRKESPATRVPGIDQ